MKYKKYLLIPALLMLAMSLIIFPLNDSSYSVTEESVISSAYTLLPPLCFVNEMYESEDKSKEITPDEIISNRVEVKVRFKLFDIIKDFFKRIF